MPRDKRPARTQRAPSAPHSSHSQSRHDRCRGCRRRHGRESCLEHEADTELGRLRGVSTLHTNAHRPANASGPRGQSLTARPHRPQSASQYPTRTRSARLERHARTHLQPSSVWWFGRCDLGGAWVGRIGSEVAHSRGVGRGSGLGIPCSRSASRPRGSLALRDTSESARDVT